ncbi:hypothetical protein BEL01nite_28230 [Bradyrhizobium elkanii]|nr:hypothetical protein BEL01nite_28230 [Bradyrhizobium elkanii]
MLARAKRVGIISLHEKRCLRLAPIPTFQGQGHRIGARSLHKLVMPGLVPGIHVLASA